MADPFVQAAARGLEALGPPSRLLVAVSGGADSVALVEALAAAGTRRALRGLRLVVGHVDHRLRAESQADSDLVAAHAARLGLPFAVDRLSLPSRANLEEEARVGRYRALVAMARAHDCTAVATGHTATDQAETLLWRLVRGSGARGLGAMAADRPLGGLRLLRPLLALTREETRAFCVRRGLAFHDDPTNVDDRPRARLRAEVLPVLERLQPGAVRRLARTAALLRADEAYLEAQVPVLDAETELSELRSLAPALRARALLSWASLPWASTGEGRRRLSAAHVEGLERLVVTGRGEVELPADTGGRRVAVAREGRLRLERPPGT